MQLAQAAPLKILAMGTFDQLPVNVHCVTKGQKFSAVFCDETTSLGFEELVRLRGDAAHDLFPIYWFGEGAPSYVDASYPDSRPQSLHEATRDAYAKIARIENLGRKQVEEDRELLNLLGYLVSRKCEAVPRWAPNNKRLVEYTGLRPEFSSRSLLMQLYRKGLLERDFWRKTHQCSKCNSSRLNVAEHCPDCKSTDLVEMDIVHHFSCGHQGPQDAFQLSAGGRMICPSCEQNLDHFGVDYDKPGRVQVCRNCRAVTENPITIFECLDCATLTLSDEAIQRDWYRFRLSAVGQEAAMLGQIPVTSLENAFGGFEPYKDYATFTALLDNGLNTAQRYDRPFSVAVMRLASDENDRDENDRDGPNVAFGTAMRKTLVKLLREILRDSDFLYAAGNQIVFVFPETDAEELQSIVDRIEARLLTDVTERPDYSFEDWSGRTFRDILQGVRVVR